jgi:hypothetical protein
MQDTFAHSLGQGAGCGNIDLDAHELAELSNDCPEIEQSHLWLRVHRQVEIA